MLGRLIVESFSENSETRVPDSKATTARNTPNRQIIIRLPNINHEKFEAEKGKEANKQTETNSV